MKILLSKLIKQKNVVKIYLKLSKKMTAQINLK